MRVNKLSSLIGAVTLALLGLLQQGVLPPKYAAFALMALHVLQSLQPSAVSTGAAAVNPVSTTSATSPAITPPNTPA